MQKQYRKNNAAKLVQIWFTSSIPLIFLRPFYR